MQGPYSLCLFHAPGPALAQSRHLANVADLLDPRSREEDANHVARCYGHADVQQMGKVWRVGVGEYWEALPGDAY